MSTYRYLDHPHPDPDDQVHVRLQLDDDALGGECVWAEPLGNDRYRVLNVPFTTSEVGMHDIVLALDLDDDEPEFVQVLRRRSRVRFHFELTASRAARSMTSLQEPLGVAIERLGPLYVANLPDRTNAAEFQTFLERHADWFERVDLVGGSRSGHAKENVGAGGDR